jgi:hypothetical protein
MLASPPTVSELHAEPEVLFWSEATGEWPQRCLVGKVIEVSQFSLDFKS